MARKKKDEEQNKKKVKTDGVVGLVGSIQTRSYDREDGQKVYLTEVVADEISFVDSKSQSDFQAPGASQSNSAPSESFGAADGFVPMPADDDLPF